MAISFQPQVELITNLEQLKHNWPMLNIKQLFKMFLKFRDPGGFFMPKECWVLPNDESSLPVWLSEEDLDHSNKFEKTGFTGGLNYWRCLNSNWELLAPWTGA
ncbi:Soluble epoxide hydrolase protein [Dioscorea alata]|uniref:Soluble epoxide hydrolase protein n=1 Tax=Dioscorea alata TaxID=55571 RepID=A0ACB7U483_DIOAL|nr:Soluble epoxide hydrolase protein [Dioscorea alata]